MHKRRLCAPAIDSFSRNRYNKLCSQRREWISDGFVHFNLKMGFDVMSLFAIVCDCKALFLLAYTHCLGIVSLVRLNKSVSPLNHNNLVSLIKELYL